MIGAVTSAEDVVATSPGQGVVSVATVDGVIARTALDVVIAALAAQIVVASTSVDRVVTGTALDDIVAVLAIDNVVPLTADDGVVAGAGERDIVAVSEVDVVVPASADRCARVASAEVVVVTAARVRPDVEVDLRGNLDHVVAAVGADLQVALTGWKPNGTVRHRSVDQRADLDGRTAIVVRRDLDVLALVGAHHNVLAADLDHIGSVDPTPELQVGGRHQAGAFELGDVVLVRPTLQHRAHGLHLPVEGGFEFRLVVDQALAELRAFLLRQRKHR